MRRSIAVSCFTYVAASLALLPVAFAHVTMRPAEAAPGTETTYTVRVPSEGSVATTSVELEIPAGISVISVAGAPDTFETKRAGERVTSIIWKTSIPPGERGELNFTAKNPASDGELAWKAHQIFSDGTRADWVEPKGSKRPAPVTVLKKPQ